MFNVTRFGSLHAACYLKCDAEKRSSLHTSQVAHQAGAYPGFSSMKRLGVFLLPLDGMLVLHRVTPCIKFAATHLYTWVERDTLRVSCPRSRHNVPCQDSNPERVSSTLTMAPPCFTTISYMLSRVIFCKICACSHFRTSVFVLICFCS